MSKKNLISTNKMKHLPSILLVLAAILSSIAIGLPIWASHDFKKQGEIQEHVSSGLWSNCVSGDYTPKKGSKNDEVQKGVACLNFTKKGVLDTTLGKAPKDILVCQILSIVGAVLAFGAGVVCFNGRKTMSKFMAIISLLCIITVLVIYPLVTLKDINDDNQKKNAKSLNVSVSYYIELAAGVLVLGGLVSCYFIKSKSKRR